MWHPRWVFQQDRPRKEWFVSHGDWRSGESIAIVKMYTPTY